MAAIPDLGEKDVMFNCAEILNDGKQTPRNVALALKYYAKAADEGHIGAYNALGFLYREGKDAAKDAVKSQSYFDKSAVKGNPVGLFESGRTAEADKNYVKAHMYYNLASARNHPRGPEALQRVSVTMPATDINKAQADACAWKAGP